MGKVITGNFSNKKRTSNITAEEPSDTLELTLINCLLDENYIILGKFCRFFDDDVNLWRLTITVKRKSKVDMVFWYDGDEPIRATSTKHGGQISFSDADEVVTTS